MRFRHLISILLLASFLLTPLSVTSGEVYKWIDANGKTVYGSKPPENAKLQEIKGNISSFTSVSVESYQYDPNLISQGKSKSASVIMYSTSWCGYCKKAARHFRKNNIPFKEYDIEKSKSAAKAYRKLNGRGVPVILIGKRRMNGFNAKRFDALYKGQT